jgi:hypothetical protein
MFGTFSINSGSCESLSRSRHSLPAWCACRRTPPRSQCPPPDNSACGCCQWADAIHKLTPDAKLGGPVFEGVDKDITLWADDQVRTSWMARFINYLMAHGHLMDLSFMSFEHYPFMVNGGSPPDEWDTLTWNQES